MKKIFKTSYLALLSIMVLALNACTSEYEYSGASVPENQVYFSNTQASSFDVDKEAGSFDIDIYRVKTSGAQTVALTFTADEDNIYNVPTSATFADGSNKTSITVTYNPEDADYGFYTGGTISIAGDIDTTYGLTSLTFSAGVSEWVDFDTNGSYGLYREDIVGPLYEFDNITYNVKIQKSVTTEGMYRVVNPYGPDYQYSSEGVFDETEDHSMIINATDPDHVYVEKLNTGLTFDEDDGVILFTSYIAYYLQYYTMDFLIQNDPEDFGTLKNGVITMPANSFIVAASKYNDGAYSFYGNENGKFAVALPGNSIVDYSLSVAYQGRFTDSSDKDYARFNLTLGEDVASVKYALVSSSSDIDAVIDGIVDGSVASEEATTSGSVEVAYGDTGKYTLVVVVYNSAGEVVDTYTIEQKLQSSQDAAEQFVNVASGILTLGSRDLSANLFESGPWGVLTDDPLPQEAVLSQSQTDPTHFKLTPFYRDGYPLSFTLDADGNIFIDQCETGYPGEDGGAVVVTDIITYVGGLGSENGDYFAEHGFMSAYYPEDNTYIFNVLYHDEKGFYACQQDVFEAEFTGESAIKAAFARAKKAAQAKKAVNITRHKGAMLRNGFTANRKFRIKK